MRRLTLLLQRLALAAIGAAAIWLIVFVVFPDVDNRLPLLLAVAVTYGIAAYVILPLALRMGLKLHQQNHVPAYTLTGDSLPGDPVNLVLQGTQDELCAAFARLGWHQADRLSLRSSWGMVRSFVLNRPYPTAPFSTLYLFGRGQDFGFQKAIDNSPRKRHHIRFWALRLDRGQDADIASLAFWTNDDVPPPGAEVYWVGAGTRDTGLSFTRLTFKFTHATDPDIAAERDFILAELQAAGVIGEATMRRAGGVLERRVNHYRTDGEVGVARLEPAGGLAGRGAQAH